MTGELSVSLQGLLTLSGGTRQEMKTSRPWQPKLQIPNDTGNCTLCKKDDESKYIPGPGWKIFQNAFTQFAYHRLLIPDSCWPEEKLRSLGGGGTMFTALNYALAEVKRTKPKPFPSWIFTHVGYGAGQNIPHNHWHILEPGTTPNSFFGGLLRDLKKEQVLRESGNLTTAIHGTRAGQTLIFPTHLHAPRDKMETAIRASSLWEDPLILAEVRNESHAVVELFNKKFFNPDYCLCLALNSETDWYVRYTPILNNWGATEFAALDNGTPFALPWPHEKTVEFLKS